MRKVDPTRLVKTIKARNLIVAVLLIAVVGLGIFYAVRPGNNKKNTAFDKDKNIAFTIDGTNYYKTDVQKLIAFPVSQGISKNVAAKTAFDALKTVRAAQKLNYAPSSIAIDSQKGVIYSSLKLSDAQKSKYSDWLDLVAKQNAINAAVSSPAVTGYAGYSYVFFFGQHLQSSADYKPKGLNDPKLVAQDKAYAKQKANYYHQQVQQKKMSPADALSNSIADMQAKWGNNTGNPTFSTSFTADESVSNAVYMPDVTKYISSQNKTGLSKVLVGKAATGPSPTHSKSADMYYYFVDLTTVPGGKYITYAQLQQALSKLPTQYRGISS